MLSQEVRDVAKQIGEFYLEKYGGDYNEAHQEIKNLQITKLEVTDTEIKITTARPGLLIGPKGENITKLCEWLGPGKKVKIYEDTDCLCLLDCLLPQPTPEGWDYV